MSADGIHQPGVDITLEDMKEESKLLEVLCEVPTATKAWCFDVDQPFSRLMVQYTQQNLPANSQRKYLRSFLLPEGPDGKAVPCSVPLELKDTLLVAPSRTGAKTLIVRANGDSGVLLEVWGKSRLLKELAVPKAVHGGIIADGYFSAGVTWSADDSRLLYVAEAPVGDKTPAWGGPEAKDAAAPKTWRGQGQYEEDWGELNTGKRQPQIFMLSLATWQVTKVGGFPEDSSLGMPVWTPDGSGVVAVVWPHTPLNFPQLRKRLGFVFCFNRPCFLHHVVLPSSSEEQQSSRNITPCQQSASAPVFTPDGKHLVFLSHEAAVASGVHRSTSALYRMPWPQGSDGSSDPQLVVPVVDGPNDLDSAPPLYPNPTGFVDQPFLDAQGNHVALTSQWGSQSAIMVVNLETGQRKLVTPTNAGNSWTLMGVSRALAWALVASPGEPPKVMVSNVGAGQDVLQWRDPMSSQDTDALPEAVSSGLQNIRCELYQHAVDDAEFGVLPFESFAIWRDDHQDAQSPQPRLPTVLVPHGGPHGGSTTTYLRTYAFLASLGYCVLAVNFRGSTGYGENMLQSLPGHAGRKDVDDCIAALDHAVKQGIADPARVGVVGGSHGGFLTGHLLGQFPDRFRCGVLRNPVLNLSLMAGISDIPDWCYIEAWGTEEGKRRIKPYPVTEDLDRFLQVSPISHVHKVRAPMAFMLGSKDRRVPDADAKQYVAALRAHGHKPSVIVFPEDTHALDKPQTEYEEWLNVALWLKRHMGSDS